MRQLLDTTLWKSKLDEHEKKRGVSPHLTAVTSAETLPVRNIQKNGVVFEYNPLSTADFLSVLKKGLEKQTLPTLPEIQFDVKELNRVRSELATFIL